ncbi:MAG: hypothetical protein ACLP7Q_24090 [Isosphaeraceae bacterium]
MKTRLGWSPLLFAVVLTLAAAPCRPLLAQLAQTEEERLQILSDPEAAKKKLHKERNRARFEFFRSQVAPFDVLPMIKPFQWNTVTLELRANYEDYDGALQFFPVQLPGMPQEVVYTREARLVKEQRSRFPLQIMLPRLPREKELNIELLQPGGIRHDEIWPVPLRLLPPHQMLMVILSKESASQYVAWNRLPSLIPAAADREDPLALDLHRYYRLVMPEEADKPFLSPHPLSWAAISHIVWDGLPPEALPVSHQQALLDWLHWGGQLVVIGGAGPTFSIFRESFLGPYLPAEPTGENKLLGEAELKPLAEAYPPPVQPALVMDFERAVPRFPEEAWPTGRKYLPPAPIQPPEGKPIFVTGLRPLPGSSSIPLGEGSPNLLAVEARVGRGRVTMLTINPTDPTLLAWPGLDTLIRRVVLRRPEESFGVLHLESPQPTRPVLEGPDLSWYRITSRDAGAEADAVRWRRAGFARPPSAGDRSSNTASGQPQVQVPGAAPGPPPQPPSFGSQGSSSSEAEEAALRRLGVAEWRDTTRLPRLCRDLLEQASGITVPSSRFVLKVIVAYLLAVVPLNWLVCRLVFKRREWAWIAVPLLALGFAVGVERMVAYDMGYDSACDEIDLLEVHGGYFRAHLSRFASLYTTGRAKYTISYPTEPTALALPLNNERSIGGEDVTTAVWQSYPVPALHDFSVQPRSLAMFRGEQIQVLAGPIAIRDAASGRTLANNSELELHDAVLVDFSGPGQRRETFLGTIGPGESVALNVPVSGSLPEHIDGLDGPDPLPLLSELRSTWEDRPENDGELRLVAWVPQPVGGENFEPALDRHRGMTAVLVHLRYGDPPSPDGPRYNSLAPRAEQVSQRPAKEVTGR